MKKIQSLFKRDYEGTRLVYNEVVDGSEWVINGEGIATRKFDGTACAIINGELYKRYDVKKGRPIPEGAISCQEPDKKTGHHPHWVKVLENDTEKQFMEAFNNLENKEDGTYELCGEKVQKNPEKITGHTLIKHGCEVLQDCPRDFDSIKNYLENKDIEGIVWHHSDGRMVKIKKKDFGFKR